MIGPTRRQSNQSKKVEIVNYYYQWKIVKPTGKRKAKKNFTVCDKIPDKGESYFERYYRNGSSLWFREIKMNCRAFV
jgi:hypothetical protein